MVKLLVTAVFPMSIFETLITEKKIDTISFGTRMAMLENAKETFPGYLKEKSNKVIKELTDAYREIEFKNEKEQQLRVLLSKYQSKNITILVNKGFYETVLTEIKIRGMVNKLGRITITTPNKLDLCGIYVSFFL